MEEKVDILLTTYNTNIEYLKQQIESILKQTYQNFRLLISDDFSEKEEVRTILKEYKKQDKRIILYLQEKNLGYNKNFEFLLKQSDSKYIMFADHDDIWYPQKVEKSVKMIQKKEVDMVYCNANQINEKGEILQKNYFRYKNVPLIKGKNKLTMTRCIGIGCSQIITDKVKNRMLPFTDEVIAHDWLASFIAGEENGLAYMEEPLLGYRLHQTNVFGGRNLTQNLTKWKEENGKNYQSYLRYRKEKVIRKAYLEGAQMCMSYVQKEEDKKLLEKVIKYYEDLEKSRYINRHVIQYFSFLAGKNLKKKMIKEMIIFHLPIFGYLIYILS